MATSFATSWFLFYPNLLYTAMFKHRQIFLFGILFSIACALFSCKEEKHLFENMPSSSTNIDFSNTLEKKKAFGILYYLYYYNGGGVSTGDINNDGLVDIYFTANSHAHNKLYLNKGNFEFEDITQKAGVAGSSDWCTGATMADVNGDGFLDIYVSSVNNTHQLKGHNELFINNGDGTFNEQSKEYGLDFSGFSTQAAFFDYDHDGDLDCYILNQSHKPNQFLIPASNRTQPDSLAGDRLYRNDLDKGNNRFIDVTQSAGIYQSALGYGLGLAVADINNDGWEDIYVGNDFHENDYYYINTGNGTFIESGADHFRHYSRFSMGNDVADYNNDGQLDVITVDMLPDKEKILKTYGSDENPGIYNFKLERNGYQHQSSKNCLQQNNGDGQSFSEVSLLAGVSATDWSWCPLFADFDNDGKKDLFITSGIISRPVDLDYVKFVSDLYIQKNMDNTDKFDDLALEKIPEGSSHPYFFKGNGESQFQPVSDDWGSGKMKGFYNGASYADLDNDGDLDLIINSLNAPAVVLKNTLEPKPYFTVSFQGEKLNTNGIGTKVYLYQNGKLQYQQLMLTRGFQSSVAPLLHFGLDSVNSIDSLMVIWPSQKYQTIKNPKSNGLLILAEKNASAHFSPSILKQNFTNYIQERTPLASHWKHQEDSFSDYNVQYLIPHAHSTRGPKLAVGDVNGDGLDDIYACGAKGQAGALLIQEKNGQFTPQNINSFAADVAYEDIDAVFIDVDKDGFLDLYVASGGNEQPTDSPLLTDRLYLNDGKGHFTKTENQIPKILQNKGSISVADVDRDGDADIFVGVLTDSRAFGIPQTSYLLLNDGRGVFSIASKAIIDLDQIGMVTSSGFGDFNSDGQMDLVVAGEWMPLTIYWNINGKFTKKSVPNSTGLWQTVLVDDVNQDGKLDFIAGNWGLNNKFTSQKNGPIRLYVKDFDKNGQVDQLLSYTLEGKEYPFLAKDEIERTMPVLKKHYVKYSDYAGLEMKDAFYGFAETVEPLVAERLASSVAFGDGNGNFELKNLPVHLQISPIFSFQKIGNQNNQILYLAGGNFFETIPYEGRYDGQPLAAFSVNRQKTISYLKSTRLSSTKGQIRDIQRLKSKAAEPLFVVARNNETLLFFKNTSVK